MSPFLWLVLEILPWLIVVGIVFFWLGLLWQKRSPQPAALVEASTTAIQEPSHDKALAAQLAGERDRHATQLAELQTSTVPRSFVNEAEANAARHEANAARLAALIADHEVEQKSLVLKLAEATHRLSLEEAKLEALNASSIPREQFDLLKQQLNLAQTEHEQALAAAQQQHAQLTEDKARLTQELAASQAPIAEAKPAKARKASATKAAAHPAEDESLAAAITQRDLLHQQLETLKATATGSEPHASTKPLALPKTAHQAEEQAHSLQAQIAFLQRLITTRPDSAPDDLTKIKGIAKVINKLLQSYGIITYRQIAEWSEAEVETVGNILAFKGRIQREKWQEQARELQW